MDDFIRNWNWTVKIFTEMQMYNTIQLLLYYRCDDMWLNSKQKICICLCRLLFIKMTSDIKYMSMVWETILIDLMQRCHLSFSLHFIHFLQFLYLVLLILFIVNRQIKILIFVDRIETIVRIQNWTTNKWRTVYLIYTYYAFGFFKQGIHLRRTFHMQCYCKKHIQETIN